METIRQQKVSALIMKEIGAIFQKRIFAYGRHDANNNRC